MQVGSGGGIAHEGEDIEVLELPIDEALAMVADGRIADAKTIMLLQYAALNIFGKRSYFFGRIFPTHQVLTGEKERIRLATIRLN